MSSSSSSFKRRGVSAEEVHKDWERREYLSKASLASRKLVQFLNNLEVSLHNRMSEVETVLTSMERKLDFVDGQLESLTATSSGVQED